MDVPESQEAQGAQSNSDEASASGTASQTTPETSQETAGRLAQEQAAEAAEGLRDQIAALRRQVRDAQDTLRDHKRRQESRTFKR